MRKERIAILGGGVGGLTTAIALNQLGYETKLFEGAPKLEGIGAGFGLASNALYAFRFLGLEREVAEAGHPIDSFNICDQHGNTLIRTDPQRLQNHFGAGNFSYHRADLHQLLLRHIPEGQIFTGHRLIDFKQEHDRVSLRFANGHTEEVDYLIASDGVQSVVRQHLVPGSAARYAGYTCWRAVVDNRIAQVKHGVEIWGKAGRFGLTPLTRDRLYWYACINTPSRNTKLKSWGINDLLNRFSGYHNDVLRAIRATHEDDLLLHDILDLRPLKHFAFNRILLLGDAAHATTPNMGQGACQAVEDAAVLACILKHSSDVKKAFVHFEKARLDRTRYIINTSRRAGFAAQLENSLLVTLRNGILKLLPDSFAEMNLRRLYEEDFISS